MFTIDEIESRVRDRPFVPLRIVTSAGQTFDVYHPDLIMFGQRSLIVGIASVNHPGRYERATRIAIMHITTLEDLPVPKLPPGNGQE
jgi:hypothetical protein